MRQTDFTYCKIIGWGCYYLSTILDDYSRYILAWRLCTTMAASDVADTLDDALSFTGLNQVKVNHKPRLFSDTGPSHIASDLEQRIGQFIDYYNHERYHESLNNLTPADVYYGHGQKVLDLREQIKLNTLATRRKMHYDNQMKSQTLMS